MERYAIKSEICGKAPRFLEKNVRTVHKVTVFQVWEGLEVHAVSMKVHRVCLPEGGGKAMATENSLDVDNLRPSFLC